MSVAIQVTAEVHASESNCESTRHGSDPEGEVLTGIGECHGQTSQEQEKEGKVWFIVNCRLRGKEDVKGDYIAESEAGLDPAQMRSRPASR